MAFQHTLPQIFENVETTLEVVLQIFENVIENKIWDGSLAVVTHPHIRPGVVLMAMASISL